MAISALEQESITTSTDEPMTIIYPTIFCNDTISREAVLKEFEKGAENLYGRIDKLPFVNPQPCDDAISRILQRMWNCRGKHTTSIDKVKMEQIIRDELHSVTPSRTKGHWIIKDIYYHDTVTAECSECGREVEIPTCMSELMYNGCPYCLTDMRGAE